MPRKFSGRLLRRARTAAGLRPEQLAHRVGRSVFTIHQYERGAAAPSAGALGALADVLGCPIDALYAPATKGGDDAA